MNQGKDFDGVGTNGRAFGPTVHGASQDASLEYTFEGRISALVDYIGISEMSLTKIS